jgi:hypothetical protein
MLYEHPCALRSSEILRIKVMLKKEAERSLRAARLDRLLAL